MSNMEKIIDLSLLVLDSRLPDDVRNYITEYRDLLEAIDECAEFEAAKLAIKFCDAYDIAPEIQSNVSNAFCVGFSFVQARQNAVEDGVLGCEKWEQKK